MDDTTNYQRYKSKDLLEVASRAPSGGNVQPWRVYVINGDSMERFRSFISSRSPGDSEYPVYPPNLQEPYRTNRYELGEAMYEKLNIPREDKPARLAHLARNFDFFGAPAAFFCFIERNKLIRTTKWTRWETTCLITFLE